MIRARHQFAVTAFFNWYTSFAIRHSFTSFRLLGNWTKTDQSVLIIGNHIGWWDGFWIHYFNQKILHRKLHFMMNESQLHKYWLFKYTGGYSVAAGKRSVFDSLNYTGELLSNPQNMVIIFPRGELHSQYDENTGFKPGIQFILKKCEQNRQAVQLAFTAAFTEWGDHSKPSVDFYFRQFQSTDFISSELEQHYRLFYQQSLVNHIKQVKS